LSVSLKVALVTPYDHAHPGGVREHIRHLDRQLQRLGHEVRVLAPSSDGCDGLDSNVIRVSGMVVPVPISGSIARISVSPGAYRRIKQILNAHRFDVVHVHEPLTPVLPLAVLRHSRAVNVGTFHAYRESSAAYHYTKPILEPFFDRLDCRIAVSAAARDMVATYFPAEYVIIPNGIDFERFGGASVAPLERYDDGRPCILFVGRLEERKGFEYLLRAFERVVQEIPRARLLVVGGYDKDDKADFVRYARKHGLSGVRFVGWVRDDKLPHYYRSANVFCAPSTGFESFGIVLLEAMAAGVPIVASDIAGYRSVVTDGKEGVLVPPANVSALASALIELLSSPERRQRMGLAGRETARRHDWATVSSQVARVYEELVERRRTKPIERAREERSHRELVRRVSSWFDPS